MSTEYVVMIVLLVAIGVFVSGVLFLYAFIWISRKLVLDRFKPRKFWFSEPVLPMILAHRGINSLEVENSLSGFKLLARIHKNGTELDAQLSSDGRVVVFHDFSLKRFFGKANDIKDLTFDDLSRFQLINYQGKPEPLVTLEAALGALKKCRLINIELKDRSLFSGALEKEVAVIIQKLKLENSVLVSSFNPFALNRFSKIMPDVARGMLVAKHGLPLYMRKLWFWHFARPDFINMSVDFINSSKATKFKAHDFGLVYWCVDNLNELQRALADKPDIIISNNPLIMTQNIDLL